LNFNAWIYYARLESIIDIHFLEHVIQSKIANNFIAIFIDGGVTKVDVVLKLLSFGVDNLFVF
jgi:imidazole glycerol phosphate synthase subunit HisF